jgi:SAM-dependent methyltransferase
MISRHAEWKSKRRQHLITWADATAPKRASWRKRNPFYYEDETRFLKFLTRKDARILEVGCGTGELLHALAPKFGVGIDISSAMISVAKTSFPNLDFICGDVEGLGDLKGGLGTFDFIVMVDTIGYLEDVQVVFTQLKDLANDDTRLIVSYYSQLWKPLIWLAELVRMKMPQPLQSWLSPDAIEHLLELSGYEVVRKERRLLSPRRFFGFGYLVNISLGQLPGIRRLCLKHYVVARLRPERNSDPKPSLSIVIPCRNEAGNILPALSRLPDFDTSVEIIFVEGHSSDNTLEEIKKAMTIFSSVDVKLLIQPGRGKADAVWTGFEAAQNDVLMILDADLTVAPEDLVKFYDLIATGQAEFVNGTRLVYPTENGSMRVLNMVANHAFARTFSWLINQRMTDTLCGTKVLSSHNYSMIKEGREYFGNFDPFGDFDLIFGASKLNLKIVELPVRYADRSYGSTQISRFKDGLLLLKMVIFGYRKLKMT